MSSSQERLGLLLKHAQTRFAARHAELLEPLGVNGRLTATLIAIDEAPGSQRDLAERLGVDRTTMVALIDELEQARLVERRPHPEDRRKNVIALTPGGHAMLIRARAASDQAEQEFLAPLSAEDARQFRTLLRRLAPIPFAEE